MKSDFLLLPCDLICDLPGESLLEAWMVTQSALGGSTVRGGWDNNGPWTVGMGGEEGGRRGGLAVYYQTKDREESVKGEVMDFVATTSLDQDEAPAVAHPMDGPAALRFGLRKLVLSMPMDIVKECMAEQKGFLVRHSLVKKYAQVKMMSGYRDAHIYIFAYWVKQMASLNEKFESISEDLVGWWAKSEWQTGLGEKLRLREILKPEESEGAENGSLDGDALEEEIDLKAMSTTKAGAGTYRDEAHSEDPSKLGFASRIQNSDPDYNARNQ
jgi:translation initiation factor eIF-2B subunit gamma